MKSLIKELVETVGPSGYEEAVRQRVLARIPADVAEVKTDALGNLIVRTGSKSSDGMRVMLAAHMDEIGVIASHIDENGFVRFTTLGGVRPGTCLGGRVHFLNGAQGVIYAERLESGDKGLAFERMFIDVGATSRPDCPVQVGEVACFERPFLDLGDRLVSKAMDDRIGVAILIETLRQLKTTPHEVFFVFSVQEEVGLRGATTAAYGVDPEVAFSVDVTDTGDTPKSAPMEVSLGKGPAIKVRDGGMLSDPRLVRHMVESAEKADLPYQLEILESGTTDARAMQLSRAGAPAGCISIPCRYVHSPSEMVDFNDVQHASRLLLELLSGPINLS